MASTTRAATTTGTRPINIPSRVRPKRAPKATVGVHTVKNKGIPKCSTNSSGGTSIGTLSDANDFKWAKAAAQIPTQNIVHSKLRVWKRIRGNLVLPSS